MAALTSYKTYLMYGKNKAWVSLVDIRDFPDLQDSPNTLDATTLSQGEEAMVLGILRSGEKTFTALYTPDDYDTLIDLEEAGDVLDVAVYFGDAGVDGIFEGRGLVTVNVTGKGVDEVLEMEITFTMEEPFEYKASASVLT